MVERRIKIIEFPSSEYESESFNCENCTSCGEALSKDEQKCEICNSPVCKLCKQPTDIQVFEWLEIPNQCSKCKRIGCGSCMTTCYQCWNIGDEEYPFLCEGCAPSDLAKINCKYHDWIMCGNCRGEYSCPECRANKNYDRYGGF